MGVFGWRSLDDCGVKAKLAPQILGKRRSGLGLWLEHLLKRVPGLLDPHASQKDVLSISLALHRVVDEEQHHQSLSRHRSSPAMLEPLPLHEGKRQAEGRGGRQVIWLVFLFVILDTSKSLAVSWAAVHGHMCASLVICAKNALSIGCGMLLAGVLHGAPGLRQCLDLRRTLRVLPIAGFFCIAQIFALQALRSFDAGSLKLISQVNLPTTTVLSWLVLGRRYSPQQWFAMALLLMATMAFLQVRMLFFDPPTQTLEQAIPDKALAMFRFLLGIALSCCASIFAERFLKHRNHVPFYIQKTNLMIGELLTASIMVHFSIHPQHKSVDTCSWEHMSFWRQLPVILIWFIHGWIAGLLVKHCSTLVKNVSHILSTLVIYFVPLLMSDSAVHHWPVTLSALLVLISVLSFAHAPLPLKQGSKTLPSRSASEIALPQMQQWRQSMRSGAAGRSINRSVPPSLRSPRREPEPEPPLLPLPAKPPSSVKLTVHSVGFLVLSFILLDATKPILVTWAHQQKAPTDTFNNGTFVLVQTMLSLLVGLTIAAQPSFSWAGGFSLQPDWRARVRCCFDVRSVLQQLPVSVCLCISKLCLMMSLQRLDAGTVRVFGQSALPLVGVSSAVFFRRRYSAQQWCSLVAISVALVAFYYVKAEVQLKTALDTTCLGRKIKVAGVSLVLGAIAFNLLGALLVERFLKGHRGRLHEQKAHLLVGEVCVNAVLVFVVPLFITDPEMRALHSPWHRGFWTGWDHRVLICAIVWIPAGWTATMLVKRCSNVLKTISQATSSVLTYVFSVFPLTLVGPPLTPEPLSSPVVLLAIAVMFAALTFNSPSAADKVRRGPGKACAKSAAEAASVASWVVDGSYQRARLVEGSAQPTVQRTTSQLQESTSVAEVVAPRGDCPEVGNAAHAAVEWDKDKAIGG